MLFSNHSIWTIKRARESRMSIWIRHSKDCFIRHVVSRLCPDETTSIWWIRLSQFLATNYWGTNSNHSNGDKNRRPLDAIQPDDACWRDTPDESQKNAFRLDGCWWPDVRVHTDVEGRILPHLSRLLQLRDNLSTFEWSTTRGLRRLCRNPPSIDLFRRRRNEPMVLVRIISASVNERMPLSSSWCKLRR